MEDYWVLQGFSEGCWRDYAEVTSFQEAADWMLAGPGHFALHKQRKKQEEEPNWEALHKLTEAYQSVRQVELQLWRAKADLADAEAAYTAWKEKRRGS